MLQLIFTTLGTHLRDADTRRIINNKIGFANLRRALNQLLPFRIRQVACPKMLRIYPGLHRKQSVHQLFLGHLQTEYRHGFILLKSHILGYIQHEGSLPHGRSCRYQNEV